MNRHDPQHRQARDRQRRQRDPSGHAPRFRPHDDDRIDNLQQFADDYYESRNFSSRRDEDAPRHSGTHGPRHDQGYPDADSYSRAYSGNREGPYGADRHHFENYGARAWTAGDRSGARNDGWRSNAFDDGSYLGNDWRDHRDEASRHWPGEEARHFAGRRDPRDLSNVDTLGVYGSRRYGSEQAPLYTRQTPKGYTRSDERIKDDVCERLYHANDIDLADVTIESRNGTLVLDGTVPERRMKHRIEDIAEQCIGVSDIENRIRVSRSNDGVRAQKQEEDTGTQGGSRRSGSSSAASRH